ncbi:Methyltransferase-like protein 7B [Dissophora globulifera]|nr:Methyltransferase-like protein 7B [Dissophora globulifera]
MSFLGRFSKTHLIIGGVLVYATGVSAALTFLPSSSTPTSESDSDRFPTESVRRKTFDTLAPSYDKEVGLHEYLLGIQRRRKRLLKQARGRVLEIASGTGRNVDYYTKGCCDEIVFSDFSEGMMEVLKTTVAKSDLGKRYDYQFRRQQQLELERIAQSQQRLQDAGGQGDVSPGAEAAVASTASALSDPATSKVVETVIKFEIMNAAAIPHPDQSFDTVVDTFGLCSFEDPVKVLKEMKRVLRPGGRLLLIEHGNSHWGFMKDMQAKQLDKHVHKYGCYWNREIGELRTLHFDDKDAPISVSPPRPTTSRYRFSVYNISGSIDWSMITVPSQEIAAFLGNHLDDVLQRTGKSFLSSVAADREFRAGCAIMDVLNAVESVQSSLRILLEKNGQKGRPSERQSLEVRVMSLYLLHCLYNYLPIQQNPFLCLFVDIYNLASQDENQKSERFVTSVILNGKGEELAPKTPSELIALAHKVESKPVNLGMLEEYLPEVPVEDQVKVGLGWDSQQTKGDKKRVWETFTIESRYGDDRNGQRSNGRQNGVQELNGHGQNGSAVVTVSATTAVTTSTATAAITTEKEKQEDEEEELEEWEIEAERRFQDSDLDDAPSLPSPASKKSSTKAKPAHVPAAEPVAKKISPTLEMAVATNSADNDQVKRRRKIWPRK